MKLPKNNKTWMPFFIEFVKFAVGFAIIIVFSLITLGFASAAGS